MKKWFPILVLSIFFSYLLQTGFVKAEYLYIKETPQPEMEQDWLQIGRDAQHTNYSPIQVDPPYCYAWKWYEVPLASRAQPVISSGRLFIGSMNGVLYARDASSGEPLWSFDSGSPIRNSAAVYQDLVIFTSHSGLTYALNTLDGALVWSFPSGPSLTAPLIDQNRGRIFLTSSNGNLTSLSSQGNLFWKVSLRDPILTTPALSLDGKVIYVGTEAIQAIALSAGTGEIIWQRKLAGQSLADRYPVIIEDAVFFRSQPLQFFHNLLHGGDDVMDLAGEWESSFIKEDWLDDWEQVRPMVIEYLKENSENQTFFALNPQSGESLGIFPVLYTFGNNDNPNPPVVRNEEIYLTYRARHGIQTDSGTIHVSSRYDAELGELDLETVDILPLSSILPLTGSGVMEWRMTSDEPFFLTMGGNILFVDNWERVGGLNVETGQNIYISAVSSDWPECNVQCGPATRLTFFPLKAGDEAYPFPSPRVTEGQQRGGVVIANDMLYWRVIEGGLGALQHSESGFCLSPQVWGPSEEKSVSDIVLQNKNHSLEDYLTLDLENDIGILPQNVVDQLEKEVQVLVDADQHWMPYYLERGFSSLRTWPYNSANEENPPSISYNLHGNLYWYDPGDLLITAGMAYPYLSISLQIQLREYINREIELFPPLELLPYNASGAKNWLGTGLARETYNVYMRDSLNNWPPVGISLNTIYGLWLWSEKTGDWSYVQENWERIGELFASLTPVDHEAGKMDYFSDLAGAIGYYRMANRLADERALEYARSTALEFMNDVIADTQSYLDRANEDYPDPRDQLNGLSTPALFGLTPEVGLFLREQTGDVVTNYLLDRENGNGLRWWYITRVGEHAERGETSYLAPNTAWSHFLGHAYLLGDTQETLFSYLDRPWAKADLYSIQKLSAVLQAEPQYAHLDSSLIEVNNLSPETGEYLTINLKLKNSGADFWDDVNIIVQMDDVLIYEDGTWILSPDQEGLDRQLVQWNGSFPEDGELELDLRVHINSPPLKFAISPIQISVSSASLMEEFSVKREVLINNPFIHE